MPRVRPTLSGRPRSFSGVCVLEPAVLDLIPEAGPSDLPRDVFPHLVSKESMYAVPLKGFRVAVDSPERLELLREAVEAGAFLVH